MTGLTRHQDPATGLADATRGVIPNGQIPQLRPIGAAATAAELTRRSAEARTVADSLAARGVGVIAISIVDNAGIARVTAVPVSGLEHATRWGVGLSPLDGVAAGEGTLTAGAPVGVVAGGLRLMPDPAALRTVSAQPGWAWAPADQYTQDGRLSGCCQRSFARRMTDLAALSGLEIRVGSEVGWFLGREEHGELIPAHDGPGYGMAVLARMAEYADALITALAQSQVRIGQFHPGETSGTLEIALPPAGPVDAADVNVLARHMIRAYSARSGWRASFLPAMLGPAGYGGRLRISIWRGGRNLLAGGKGQHGLTADGESFVAGILAELPALMAVGAPSVASYRCPTGSAGAADGGRSHDREAAMRFITGPTGAQPDAASVEIGGFDQTANPYLAAGCVIAAGLAGLEGRRTLAAEASGAAERLPRSLDEAVAALRQSEAIPAAMGPVLYDAFTASREAESQAFQGKDPEAIAAACRWRH